MHVEMPKQGQANLNRHLGLELGKDKQLTDSVRLGVEWQTL